MRKTLGARRLLSSLVTGFTLLVALPVAADDEYPATAYFLDGLTELSSWREILAKPGMKAEFPFIAFDTTFVPLESVCVDGAMLAIANPGLDTGVRVPAAELQAQAEAAVRGRFVVQPSTVLAAAIPGEPGGRAAMRYPVTVAKWIERGLLRQRIFLFEKLWPVPVCSAR
jgi:hypothetical protein